MMNDYRSRWVAILILEQTQTAVFGKFQLNSPFFIYFIDLWAPDEAIYVGGILRFFSISLDGWFWYSKNWAAFCANFF